MTMTRFRADRRVRTLRIALAAVPLHRARILRALALSSHHGEGRRGHAGAAIRPHA